MAIQNTTVTFWASVLQLFRLQEFVEWLQQGYWWRHHDSCGMVDPWWDLHLSMNPSRQELCQIHLDFYSFLYGLYPIIFLKELFWMDLAFNFYSLGEAKQNVIIHDKIITTQNHNLWTLTNGNLFSLRAHSVVWTLSKCCGLTLHRHYFAHNCGTLFDRQCKINVV